MEAINIKTIGNTSWELDFYEELLFSYILDESKMQNIYHKIIDTLD